MAEDHTGRPLPLPPTLDDGRWLAVGTRPGHGFAPDGRTPAVFIDFALSPVPAWMDAPPEAPTDYGDVIGIDMPLDLAEDFLEQLRGQVEEARRQQGGG